jgi:hypothetical protein
MWSRGMACVHYSYRNSGNGRCCCVIDVFESLAEVTPIR